MAIRTDPCAGFTILEALVAITLLGAITMSIAGLLPAAMTATTSSEEITHLSVSAVAQAEWLMLIPFDSAELQAGGSTKTSETGYSVDPWEFDPARYVRWEISDESAFLKRIVVVSGSRDAGMGKVREMRVETFRLKSG